MSNNYIPALQAVLADTYTLYLKTQNYHWNVEGRHFKQLHELFEEQYKDLAEANDDVAERIRTLGEKVDGSYKGFAKHASIQEGDYTLDENAMVKDLFDSNLQMVKTLKTAMDAAEAVDDQASVDMMVERTQVHEKAAWMLRSVLPEAIRNEMQPAAKYA